MNSGLACLSLWEYLRRTARPLAVLRTDRARISASIAAAVFLTSFKRIFALLSVTDFNLIYYTKSSKFQDSIALVYAGFRQRAIQHADVMANESQQNSPILFQSGIVCTVTSLLGYESLHFIAGCDILILIPLTCALLNSTFS